MIARLFIVLGAILVILGVLKYVGIATGIASAAAATLIVVGAILILVGQYVFGGWVGRGGGPVV